MATNTANVSMRIGGLSISAQISREAAGQISQDVSLAAAKTGTLTTRSDDNTGTLTMTAGHGITTGAIIDVYWATGVQRKITVGTVSVNSVPFDSGVGDNMPAQDTAITACVQTVLDVDFSGDLLVMGGISGDRRCHFDIQQNDGTNILALELDAGEGWVWWDTGAVTNPLAGVTVGKIAVTNGDSAGVCKLKVGIQYDSES